MCAIIFVGEIMEKAIEDKIIEIIDAMRPYLNADGGDIEFIKYDNGTAFVRLAGACAHCGYQDSTLQDSILKSLQEEVPEIKEIINVEI